MEHNLNTFEEFWPYYLREHARPTTRQWHFLGTSVALTCIVIVLLFGYWQVLLLGIISGYGPAWYSHFHIEKNRPATFTYPVWSLRADLKLFVYMLSGALDEELAKYRIVPPSN